MVVEVVFCEVIVREENVCFVVGVVYCELFFEVFEL